ncbi:MAG TPA: c-type cytochrome [Candidatus Sulfotelmatobacter sp.]|jgi:cytochrome c|nr:c-type cytochrome [Candidatus Sulfotelmatobacter sp.]
MKRSWSLAALVAAATVAVATPALAAGDAAAGEKAFAPCKACHAVVADKNLIGPSLFGAAGRKAGTLASFNGKYSPQLVAANLTWDDATLDKWLTSPKDLVAGTKMTFVGLKDAKAREDVIAYLKTLK